MWRWNLGELGGEVDRGEVVTFRQMQNVGRGWEGVEVQRLQQDWKATLLIKRRAHFIHSFIPRRTARASVLNLRSANPDSVLT